MADGAGRRWTAALLIAAACARPEIAPVTPDVIVPEIRIALPAGGQWVTLGGAGSLRVSTPDGSTSFTIAAGSTIRVSAGPGGLSISLEEPPVASLTVAPADSGMPVRINDREYRGSLVLSPGARGVTAVNVVGVEDYLRGVVGAEMGRRTEPDLAALRAQAVVSRTLALKSLGRWRTRGYDLLATVADQAYAGIGFESPLSDQAVQETTGKVLTFEGGLIDIFFHSTCGGRTAPGPEVFVYASRPYLRSIADVDPGGRAWCAISPRYQWRESWSGEALAQALRATLPAAGGDPTLANDLRDIRVLDRTGTGRVARMELVGRGSSLTVTGPTARLLLRTRDGAILRSANFTLQVTREGTRIVELTATGSGAGHGVGMCQWGAMGRARAGFSYEDILSAYFPGTALVRTY
ncbi:MAG TPA: SpoIID/LytB domain-containing protein [Gemmatimonadales bacterium]